MCDAPVADSELTRGYDRTNYLLTSTEYQNSSSSHAYSNVTGHDPSVYKEYTYAEGSILAGSETVRGVIQWDNIILMTRATIT